MNPREFFINPADYGLPTRDELVGYRIWDNHFHGFAAKNPIEQYERNNFFVERMGIERSIAQEIGGTLEEPFAPYQYDAEILRILKRDKDRLSGRTPIDPGFPDESCAKIEKWIRDGPCIGIKYPGTGKKAVTCSHPNNDPIMRLAAELGVRAVRPFKNVLLEFAGSDPHSGMVEYAIRELGVERLVWGGHGPSRSYATELGKVLDADISKANRTKIFGGNLRRITASIFRKKGMSIEP